MAARKRLLRTVEGRASVRARELIETLTQTDAQLRLNFKIHRKAWAELRPLLKTLLQPGNETGPGSAHESEAESEAGNGRRE